jgi:hypothetical protein
MTEPHAAARVMTQRREMGRMMPRGFTRTCWWRFSQDRRRRYLALLPGPPSDVQAARIDSLVRLEWSALKAEAEGGLTGLREAREHRRLYEKLLADFEKSLAKPPQPAERPPSLAGHLGRVAARREGSAA